MDLSATIHLLGETLGEVLRAQESVALFETEERIRSLAKARRAGEPGTAEALAEAVEALSADEARVTSSAFAVYFDLVNLAEEAQRVWALRERERAAHPAPIGESLRAAVGQLRARGVSAGEMAQLLRDLRIELVLTAHPTEAKRRTVLSKLQRIGEALRRLRGPDLLPREREGAMAGLRAEITALWLTERARTVRPAVTDEVRTGLYFVDEVFWDAVPGSRPSSAPPSPSTTPGSRRHAAGSPWPRGSAGTATGTRRSSPPSPPRRSGCTAGSPSSGTGAPSTTSPAGSA